MFSSFSGSGCLKSSGSRSATLVKGEEKLHYLENHLEDMISCLLCDDVFHLYLTAVLHLQVGVLSLSSLLGKNIKLWRVEGNIMGVGKNIAWKKGQGKQYCLSYIIGVVGKYIEWAKGKGMQILKNMGGEEYQVVGNFIHPCLQDTHSTPSVSSSNYISSPSNPRS